MNWPIINKNKSWKSIFRDKKHNYNIAIKQNLDKSKIINSHLSSKVLNLAFKYIYDLFKFKKGDLILDFGSGSGNFLSYIEKKKDLQKVSVEINLELIKYQKKYLKKTKYIFWNSNIKAIPKKIKNIKGECLIANSSLQYLPKKIIYRLLSIFIKNFKKIILIDIKDMKKKKLFINRQVKKYNKPINKIYSRRNQLTFFFKTELFFFLKKFKSIKYKLIDKKKSNCSNEGFSVLIEKIVT